MTDPLFDDAEGTTPITEEEAEGLRLSWVRTRGDLNDAEATNILRSMRTAPPRSLEGVLDDLWLRRLHRLMFGEVWTWAGSYRLSDRNIGIAWPEIPSAVRSLTADARTWLAHQAPSAAVARFHHRLLLVHPFPNGNGRHARAVAGHLCRAVGIEQPSWGAGAPDRSGVRRAYVRALRSADRDGDDLDQLVEFIWS